MQYHAQRQRGGMAAVQAVAPPGAARPRVIEWQHLDKRKFFLWGPAVFSCVRVLTHPGELRQRTLGTALRRGAGLKAQHHPLAALHTLPSTAPRSHVDKDSPAGVWGCRVCAAEIAGVAQNPLASSQAQRYPDAVHVCPPAFFAEPKEAQPVPRHVPRAAVHPAHGGRAGAVQGVRRELSVPGGGAGVHHHV